MNGRVVRSTSPSLQTSSFRRLGDGNVDLMKLLASRANGVSALRGKRRRISRLLETPSTSASGSGNGLRPEGRTPELPSKDDFANRHRQSCGRQPRLASD